MPRECYWKKEGANFSAVPIGKAEQMFDSSNLFINFQTLS